MGNQHGKQTRATYYEDEEFLQKSYRSACGNNNNKLRKESLVECWSEIIDPHLVQCTASFLFKTGVQRLTTITMRQYGEPLYIVERGTIDDKLHMLAGSLEKTEQNQYAIKDLENYVASVFRSYQNILERQNSPVYCSWKNLGYRAAQRSILAFAKGLIRSLPKAQAHIADSEQLEHWLQYNPTFLTIWHAVFEYLYHKHSKSGHHYKLTGIINSDSEQASPSNDSQHTQSGAHILPLCEGLALGTNYTPILDIPHVIFVNCNLPALRRNKWRFLFSSKIMGESFSTMLGKIQNKGPTLLIVEDEDRYIFAGYAPESWALRPSFVGDDTSVLFTLSPAMRCFSATGYNNHYQYLNMNQQTMPNGLGMGGQFHFWGLWIDKDYGNGQSVETCTTYRDYVQLSKRKEFRIRNLEVWGIGDEPKSGDDSDEDGKRESVLDKHMEDRVMLELAGKKMHSDGLRDPDMDL